MNLERISIQNQSNSKAISLIWRNSKFQSIENSALYIHNRNIPWVICMPNTVGCAMKCKFCSIQYSNSPTLIEYKEIWKIYKKSLSILNPPREHQISFMGHGEPLLNLDNIIKFCNKLLSINDQVVVGFSTVGITDKLDILMNQDFSKRIKLQISFHAWPSEKRKQIIPVEAKYPIEETINIAMRYAIKYDKKYCINYVLFSDFNDSEDDVEKLCSIINQKYFYIKVSSFNSFNNSSLISASSERTEKFINLLKQKKYEVHSFTSLGVAIGVGCGQTSILANLE